jgi:hypothetical protein
MQRARISDAGQALSPPMCILVDPNGRVMWGEYDSRRAHGKPIRVFVSDDGGASYEVAFVFEGGSIRHVHSLLYDPTANGYWVFVGDELHEPGIGFLSGDFKTLEWLGKGEQRYRAVEAFDFGDHLVYGIDSELERNAIVAMDKKSGRVERLQELSGSCIYACRFGSIFAMSTSVEPSHVNTSPMAELWLSRDGHQWSRCFSGRKDIFPPRLFQFGSIVLPRGCGPSETIILSGQALSGIDNTILVANWNGAS